LNDNEPLIPGEVDELHPELLHAATIISTGESVVLMEDGTSETFMVAANSCSLIVLGSENMTTAYSTGRLKEVNVKL
jgi:hypothetical protein